jgi:hypothetical protein
MVWLVVNWFQEMDHSAPTVALFKSKESAVKYMVNQVKSYAKDYVPAGEVLGQFKTWKAFTEALIDGSADNIDIKDYSYWKLLEKNPK